MVSVLEGLDSALVGSTGLVSETVAAYRKQRGDDLGQSEQFDDSTRTRPVSPGSHDAVLPRVRPADTKVDLNEELWALDAARGERGDGDENSETQHHGPHNTELSEECNPIRNPS